MRARPWAGARDGGRSWTSQRPRRMAASGLRPSRWAHERHFPPGKNTANAVPQGQCDRGARLPLRAGGVRTNSRREASTAELGVRHGPPGASPMTERSPAARPVIPAADRTARWSSQPLDRRIDGQSARPRACTSNQPSSTDARLLRARFEISAPRRLRKGLVTLASNISSPSERLRLRIRAIAQGLGSR